MARFFLSTITTTGEVLPFRHLALALAERGHTVRVASHPLHRDLFEEFEFVPAAADLSIEDLNRILDVSEPYRLQPLKQFQILLEQAILKDPAKQWRAYRELGKGMDAAVCHRFDYFGQEAALRAGIPFATFFLQSTSLPTQQVRPVFAASSIPDPRQRQATWDRLQENSQHICEQFNAGIQELFGKLGIPPRPLSRLGGESPSLNLLASSPLLDPPCDDWEETVVQTGPWQGKPSEGRLDAELTSFLEQNPRPVVVSLGSMGGTHGDEVVRILDAALDSIGRPAIIQAGYQGLRGEDREDRRFIGSVPHDLLFPHAGCVVHHAGAGTSVAALAAGVPAVPVPHLYDQPFFARALGLLEVATEFIPRPELEASSLAARLTEALENPGLATRAKAVGAKIRGEDGVAVAVEQVERLAAC